MAEKFIQTDTFTAFVTKNKPDCEKGGEHVWDGDTRYTFHNSDKVMNKVEFELMNKDEQNKLNVAGGEVTCSKCGIGYTDYDNPLYSEI